MGDDVLLIDYILGEASKRMHGSITIHHTLQEWIPRPTYGAPIHYKCALKGTVTDQTKT